MEVVGREEARDWQDTVTGRYRGKDYYSPEICLELYEDDQPRYELVREWCGDRVAEEFDRVVALEAEVARLRQIIEDQATSLRLSGHPRLAKNLLSVLNDPKSETVFGHSE